MRRKWVFGILILVIVGIILAIVFINLFKDRDTKALAEELNDVATEGYMSEQSDEYLTIDAYLENVQTYFDDSAEKKEIKNYQDAYSAFVIAIDLFNKQMIFTEYTDEYNDNFKAIQKDLKTAQEAAEELKGYVNQTKEVVGSSPFWNVNTWQTSRDYMKTIFDCSKDALYRLGNVYQASVTSKLMNNDFTDIIFDGFTNLCNQVAASLTENGSKGEELKTFVEAYYSEVNEEYILGYNYNLVLQANVKDIKEKGIESGLYTEFLTGQLEGRVAV